MDAMSIDSASALQQAQTGQQVAVAVARKSLDTQKEQGAAMVELIRSAGVQPGPKPGQGSCADGRCDIYA